VRYKSIISQLFILICLLSASCAAEAAGDMNATNDEDSARAEQNADSEQSEDRAPAADVSIVDSAGREISVPARPERVAALTSSLADLWVISGGTLSSTSDDTFRERPALTPENAGVVDLGVLTEPDAERLLALSPDLVLLSDTIPSHKKLASVLNEAGIPHYFAKADTFEDFLHGLRNFTALTERPDLYEQVGASQEEKIDELLARVPTGVARPTVLFIRVSTSKIDALARDHVVCAIIDDAGAKNIAFTEDASLTNLSLEAISKVDPDYIFAVTQGSDAGASIKVLEERFTSSPLWEDLSAVKNDRFHILPKDLYQLKPNARWEEAYERLLGILYPDVF
jgi:iron complex transport system substrate-binding protein